MMPERITTAGAAGNARRRNSLSTLSPQGLSANTSSAARAMNWKSTVPDAAGVSRPRDVPWDAATCLEAAETSATASRLAACCPPGAAAAARAVPASVVTSTEREPSAPGAAALREISEGLSFVSAATGAAASALVESMNPAGLLQSDGMTASPTAEKLIIEEPFCQSRIRSPESSSSPAAAAATAAASAAASAVSVNRELLAPEFAAGGKPVAGAVEQQLVEHALRLLRDFAAAVLCATQPEAAAVAASVTSVATATAAGGVGAAAAAAPAERYLKEELFYSTAAPRDARTQKCRGFTSSWSHAGPACASSAGEEIVSPVGLLCLAAPPLQQQQEEQQEQQQQQERQKQVLLRAVAAAAELRRLLLLLCTEITTYHGFEGGEEASGNAAATADACLLDSSSCARAKEMLLLLRQQRHCTQHHWEPQRHLEEELLLYLQEQQHDEQQIHGSAADSATLAMAERGEEDDALQQQQRLLGRKQQMRGMIETLHLTQRRGSNGSNSSSESSSRSSSSTISRSSSNGGHSNSRRRNSYDVPRSSAAAADGSAVISRRRHPETTGARSGHCSSARAAAAPQAAGVSVQPAAGTIETAGEGATTTYAAGKKKKGVVRGVLRASEACRRHLLLQFWRRQHQQRQLLQQLERIFLFCSSVRSSPTLLSAYLLLLLCTPGDGADTFLLSLAGFWKTCDDAEDAAVLADAACCAAAADAQAATAAAADAEQTAAADAEAAAAAADGETTVASDAEATADCSGRKAVPGAASSVVSLSFSSLGAGGDLAAAPCKPARGGEPSRVVTSAAGVGAACPMQHEQQHRYQIRAAAGAADVDGSTARCCCCCQWRLLRRAHCIEYVRCFVAELLPLLLWMYTSRCLLPPRRLCLMHSSLLLLPHVDVVAVASAAVASTRDAAAEEAPSSCALAAEKEAAAAAEGVRDYLHAVLESPTFVEQQSADNYVGLENLLLLLAGEPCALLHVAAAAAAAFAAAAAASLTSTGGRFTERGTVEALSATLQQMTQQQELAVVAAAAQGMSGAELVISRGAAAAAAPPHTLVAAAVSDASSSAFTRVKQLLAAALPPTPIKEAAAASSAPQPFKLDRADPAAVAATVAAQHADAEVLLRVLNGDSSSSEAASCSSAARSGRIRVRENRKQDRSANSVSIFDGRNVDADFGRGTGAAAAAARGGGQSPGEGGTATSATNEEERIQWDAMLRGETILIRSSVGFPLSRMTAQQQQQLTMRCLSTYSLYSGLCAALEKHVMEHFVAAGAAAMAGLGGSCCSKKTLVPSYKLQCSRQGSSCHSPSDTIGRDSNHSTQSFAEYLAEEGDASPRKRGKAVNRGNSTRSLSSVCCSSIRFGNRGGGSRGSGRDITKGSCSDRRRSCKVVDTTDPLKIQVSSIIAAGAGWPGVAGSAAAAAEKGEEQVFLQPQEHLEMLTAWYLAAIASSKAFQPVSLRHVLPQPLLPMMQQQQEQQQQHHFLNSRCCSKCSSKHLSIRNLMKGAWCLCKACTVSGRDTAARSSSCLRQPRDAGCAAARPGVRSLEDVRNIVAAALSEETDAELWDSQQQRHSLYTLEQLLTMPVDPWDSNSFPPPAAVSEGLLLQAATTLGRLLFQRQRLNFSPDLLENNSSSGGRRSWRSSNSSKSLFDSSSNCGDDTALLNELAAAQEGGLEQLRQTWKHVAEQRLLLQLHKTKCAEAWSEEQEEQQQQFAGPAVQEMFVVRQQDPYRVGVAEGHEGRQREHQGSACCSRQSQRQQHNREARGSLLVDNFWKADTSSPVCNAQLPSRMTQQPEMIQVQELSTLTLQQQQWVHLGRQQVLRLLLLHQPRHFGCSCEALGSANILSCAALTDLAACCCFDGLSAVTVSRCRPPDEEEVPSSGFSGLQKLQQQSLKQVQGQLEPSARDSHACSSCNSRATLSEETAAVARVWGAAWLRQRLLRQELGAALEATEKRAAAEVLLKSYWTAVALRNILK